MSKQQQRTGRDTMSTITTITTKSGTTVTLTTDGNGVNATARGETFGVVRTSDGIESRFGVVGNSKITMPLTADMLAIVDGMFAQVDAHIAAMAAIYNTSNARRAFIAAQGE